MKRRRLHNPRTRVLASCAIGMLVLGLGAIVAFASNPEMFSPINQAIAVAASPERILVMTYCDNPRQIVQVDGTGTVTPFATLPEREPGCIEDDLHFSSGLGGWAPGYVYATEETKIYRISPDGATVTLFAMAPTAVSGLVFDKIGSFGYDMLVTGGYSVYRISPAGTVTLVGCFTERVKGPDVAPMSFGPYGGNVFVGSDGNHLLAMSPTGNATMIGTWFSPGRVHFVPDRLGTLNGTELSYFTAVYPDGVVAYPHSDFDTLAGCALVASDTGSGVAAVSWTGTQYVVVPWCTASYHHERSDFVDFDQPRAVPFDIDPRDCPNWLNTNGGGILQAAILGTSDFNVNTIDPGTVRLAGVAPLRSRFTDCSTPFEPYLGKDNCTADCTAQGRDNYLDLLFQFDKRAVVRALGQVYDRQCMVLRMTGNTYDGRPLAGEDVVIILKRH